MDIPRPIKEHVQELKKSLIHVSVFMIISFIIMFLISEPLILGLTNYYNLELVSLAPLEFLRTQLQLSMYFTIMLTIPYIIVKSYNFVQPIIQEKTRSKSVKYFITSLILTFLGFLFSLIIFTKTTLAYFEKLPQQITMMWGVQSTLGFILINMLAFGLMTQLVIIIPLLNKWGLVKIETFKKSRSFILVLLLLISAIITTPDPLTQIMMTIPMYACFETGLLISKYQNKTMEAQPI